MILNIDFPDSQIRQLEEQAKRLGVRKEELARAALLDLLSSPEDEFTETADMVIRKNKKLYDRLK